jgi:O-antigen ligase
MYWQYRALRAILSGAPALFYIGLTFLVSIPWFLAAVWMFRKKQPFGKRGERYGVVLVALIAVGVIAIVWLKIILFRSIFKSSAKRKSSASATRRTTDSWQRRKN